MIPRNQKKHRSTIFQFQQQVAQRDINICKPIEFVESDNEIYSVQSWVFGDDAQDIIPTLTPSQQYSYGCEAGAMLKEIHSITLAIQKEDWATRFNAKLDRKIKQYIECPIQFEKADNLIDYINKHRHLLVNRPQTFQHGDYHIGNMMIENNQIVIIDFERCDVGDPWEEFNRIVMTAPVSPLFASGMIDGYFDHDIPDVFWKLLALYIFSNTLSSIPWALQYGEHEVAIMQNQVKAWVNMFDNFTDPIPNWYVKR